MLQAEAKGICNDREMIAETQNYFFVGCSLGEITLASVP